MKIEHISVSRNQCYELCHMQYKYKYHLQVTTNQPTPFYFTFGKLIHRIIEEHTKSKGEKSIQRIKSEILSGVLEFQPGEKCPHLDNESHLRLNKNLHNYMNLAEKIGYEGETEWNFLIDIDQPNKRMLKGFIDRLIIKNNTAFILDFKTTKPSKWRKDSNTITKDFQLACYCWIVNKTFGIPAKNIKAALYYLEDAKLVPVSFGEKTLESVPTKLVNAFKEIERYDPDKVIGNVGEHCRRCDYRSMCPFYSLT